MESRQSILRNTQMTVSWHRGRLSVSTRIDYKTQPQNALLSPHAEDVFALEMQGIALGLFHRGALCRRHMYDRATTARADQG